ncbi:MAG TPA: aminotransferase class V-fold PLP-dependent enzyme [Ignavibacteriaceae bacterium]|nr:aminotransferase class V-fold PLP-dependent enzyme [Ignavibacteriaceae bacterium]
MDLKEVREYFPHINKGITYLNHAATGPLSQKVLEVMNEFFLSKSEESIDDYTGFVKITDETKEIIASLLNADIKRIAFGDNTTNGMNLIAQGLKWNKGDEIILNDIEFPANVYPFLNLRKQGVNVIFVKSHDGVVSAEDIIERMTKNTRLVSVSMVQFLSGYRIDLGLLGEICSQNNIYLSVDAIQGLGALNLDVQKNKIDFMSCGTQKWLLALQGLAIYYFSDKLFDTLEPAYVGWLGVKNAWEMLDYKLILKNSAERFQPGTISTVGVFALNAALKLFRDFGFKEVEERVISNSEFLLNELQKLNIKPYLRKLDKRYLSGIVSFKHPEAWSILEILKDRKIEAAVREGTVRISPHFYNNEDDFAKLLCAFRSLN